jgi:hypothetical protein
LKSTPLYTWILHELEAFICKAFKGEAIQFIAYLNESRGCARSAASRAKP